MNHHDLSVEAFETYLVRVRAANTAMKYSQAAEKFLAYCAEQKLPFDRLPPGVLSGFASHLSGQGAAPRSIHVYVAGARRYLEWCRAQGSTIPILAKGDLPKVHSDSTPNALRDDVLLKYLAVASRIREPVRTALLILPYCGLRSEELVTLSLQSVKRVSLALRGGGHADHAVFVVRGKGGDVRVVPLLVDGPPLLLDYLRGWRAHQNGNWLFPMPGGEPLSTRTLRYYVQTVRNTLRLKQLTPHTLRRTYLTTLWRAGIDVPTLTKIAGHKSVQTTFTHYLDVRPEDVAGAVQRVGAKLVMNTPTQLAGARVADFLKRSADERKV